MRIFNSSKRLIPVAIIVAVALVYYPVVGFEFINFDDDVYVTANARVLSGLNWDNVRWAFTATDAGFWQPLTWLSLMFDSELYGLDAGGYHLTNVLFHGAATLVLFFALRELTGAVGRSAMVSVLFAVHPLHVESVAWVGERKDVLCGLFWMLTMLAYARYVAFPTRGRYAVVMLWFLCGLMSKAMVVTLPLVLLLLDYWPLRRLGDRPTLAGGVKDNLHILLEKVPMLVFSGVVTAVTFYAEEKTGALNDLVVYPWDVRLANALVAFKTYLVKTVWPLELAIYYPHPGRVQWVPTLTSALTLALATQLVFRYRKKAPYAFAGWFWYIGTLLPVIGLVQIGGHAMADRYTYIPLTGVFILAIWGGYDLLVALGIQRRWLAAAGVVVVVALMVISSRQVRFWSDSVTVFQRAVEVTGDHYIAAYNSGLALKERGRLVEAEQRLRQAVAFQPRSVAALNNLGVVLALQGKDEEAMTFFKMVTMFDPYHAGAYNNLGVVYYRRGHMSEAKTRFAEALRLCPDYANAHYYMALILAGEDKTQEAEVHFHRAKEINPAFTHPTGAEGYRKP